MCSKKTKEDSTLLHDKVEIKDTTEINKSELVDPNPDDEDSQDRYSPHNSNKETAKMISVFLKNISKDDLKLLTKDQRKFQVMMRIDCYGMNFQYQHLIFNNLLNI